MLTLTAVLRAWRACTARRAQRAFVQRMWWWAAEALARSGVGRLTLIDLDHVAESNINRQIHALTPTLGQAKVQAMRERIAHINPQAQVRTVEEFVSADNWPHLLAVAHGGGSDTPDHAPDAVIDACDQVRAKVAMAAWARMGKQLFVSVGAAGGKRLAHQVDVADLALVTHDPLLAQVRNRLRRDHDAPRGGKRMGLACVFSREPVQGPDAACQVEGWSSAIADSSLNCSGYGSVVAVTATFGHCAAGWVLDALART
jgi:tRNA threonylcarbamoyladenosine dehydratase